MRGAFRKLVKNDAQPGPWDLQPERKQLCCCWRVPRDLAPCNQHQQTMITDSGGIDGLPTSGCLDICTLVVVCQ